jgi:hypothetical protein
MSDQPTSASLGRPVRSGAFVMFVAVLAVVGWFVPSRLEPSGVADAVAAGPLTAPIDVSSLYEQLEAVDLFTATFLYAPSPSAPLSQEFVVVCTPDAASTVTPTPFGSVETVASETSLWRRFVVTDDVAARVDSDFEVQTGPLSIRPAELLGTWWGAQRTGDPGAASALDGLPGVAELCSLPALVTWGMQRPVAGELERFEQGSGSGGSASDGGDGSYVLRFDDGAVLKTVVANGYVVSSALERPGQEELTQVVFSYRPAEVVEPRGSVFDADVFASLDYQMYRLPGLLPEMAEFGVDDGGVPLDPTAP